MKCPKCGNDDTRVVDSRIIDDGMTIRRRRGCESCSFRFSTFERASISDLIVIKRDGSREMYDRDKLLNAIMLAYAKRKIDQEVIDDLMGQLESRWIGLKEVDSKTIGNDVLDVIKSHDAVAYIRFASVYKEFESVDDFLNLIKESS